LGWSTFWLPQALKVGNFYFTVYIFLEGFLSISPLSLELRGILLSRGGVEFVLITGIF